MKNVVAIILSFCKTKVLTLQSLDGKRGKMCWSLPNMDIHWDVKLPKLSGKKGFEVLFNTFTFGLIEYEENILKKLTLPSKNQAYIYVCKEEKDEDNIKKVFENIKKKFIDLDIKKLNFINLNEFKKVYAFSMYHYESIEAIQYFLDCIDNI